MIQFHALEIPQLERFLERQKAGLSLKTDVDLDLILRQILQKANEFVPSESGSIPSSIPRSQRRPSEATASCSCDSATAAAPTPAAATDTACKPTTSRTGSAAAAPT